MKETLLAKAKNFKTKNNIGFTDKELETLIKNELTDNEKNLFYKTLSGQTRTVVDGEGLTYHSDVRYSLNLVFKNYGIINNKRTDAILYYHQSKLALLAIDYIDKNGFERFMQELNISKSKVNSMLDMKHNYTLLQMVKIYAINGFEFEM